MIIPSLWPDTLDNLFHQINVFSSLAPAPQRVQIDLFDSTYSPTNSLLPGEVVPHLPAAWKIEWHCMLNKSNFDEYINLIPQSHAIIIPWRLLEEGASAPNHPLGIALEPDDNLRDVRMFLSTKKDTVARIQIMGNQSGKQGQEILEKTGRAVTIIALWRELLDLSYKIAVDIGVNGETAPELNKAGADNLVVGSYLSKAKNPQENWTRLTSTQAN